MNQESGGGKPRSREDRLREGRAQREKSSRSKLGEPPVRKAGFDPIALLHTAAAGRVPALLPIKYKRMSASPFAFFRGAVSIMAADLASQPHTGLLVQLCGDAHLQNLGSFEGPDARIVFDLNDFDETIAGPWEWDVKRMAASIVLVGLESNHRQRECATAAEAFAASYCNWIENLAEQPILVAARHQIHRERRIEAVSSAIKQARRACPSDLIQKYTVTNASGARRFKKVENELWVLRAEHRRAALDSLPLYRESLAPERLHLFQFFEPRDLAFKVVGTGSVGLRDYVVLMEGNGPEDALFLQIKQEVASAYAPYLKGRHYPNQGQRVVAGQRGIQSQSDLLLGWTRIGEHDYLVRQLNDHKGSIDLTTLAGEGLASLSAVAGEILARGHARSGDALTIKGYIGNSEKVVKGIVQYGLKYAALTEADFATFQKAMKQGLLKAATP